MKACTLALAVILTFIGYAGAQTPAFYLNTDNTDFYPSKIYELQANQQPTTIWFKMLLTDRQYDWKRMSVVGAFSTSLLLEPVTIPGVGAIQINPATLLHFDPAMQTRFVRMRNSTVAEVITWTVFPRIPSTLIGTRFYGQFIAYESNSSNPRWTTSTVYPNPNATSFAWVILPG